MREISYHKDYRHNYLIIREDEMTGDAYQRKMITENRIRGLLPCQIRYINGETLLYYEITSKQSVKGLFEGKHLTMKELKGLFISLKMVMEETASFLLPEDGLLIEPDMIFTELEKEEFYFVYDPFSESRGTQTLITLLEFLAESKREKRKICHSRKRKRKCFHMESMKRPVLKEYKVSGRNMGIPSIFHGQQTVKTSCTE